MNLCLQYILLYVMYFFSNGSIQNLSTQRPFKLQRMPTSMNIDIYLSKNLTKNNSIIYLDKRVSKDLFIDSKRS